VFGTVLAWSGYRVVHLATDQTRSTTLSLLAECFEGLGGVPAVLLTDRMGSLRASTVDHVVVPHPEYVPSCARNGRGTDSVKRLIPSRRTSSMTWSGTRQPIS
jgi:hypothetical protein